MFTTFGAMAETGKEELIPVNGNPWGLGKARDAVPTLGKAQGVVRFK